MHQQNIRRALRSAGLLIVLMAIAGCAGTRPSPATKPAEAPAAAATPATVPAAPLRFTVYHTHYDIQPDFGYVEQDDDRVELLSMDGVAMTRVLPLGIPSPLIPGSRGKREVEVLAAYVLKKDGRHIPAVATQPPPGVNANAVQGAKWMSFPGAEIGDILVTSFTITQKGAAVPDNVVLSEDFLPVIAYNDAEVTLTAPADMKLRFTLQDVAPGKSTGSGGLQRWTWKYSNLNPVAPDPNSQHGPTIHISSFPSDEAEAAYFNSAKQAARLQAMAAPGYHCPVLVRPDDGHYARDILANTLATYFWRAPEAFDDLAGQLNTPSCVFDDGEPKLNAVEYAYTAAFLRSDDWDKTRVQVETLKKQISDKPLAAMAEAMYWKTYAWNARGAGYAGSVTDEGAALFRERLEKAEQVLNDSRSYATQNPMWYEEMVDVQGSLGRPAAERQRIFIEGATQYRTYYPLYFAWLNYLQPKWGGDWRSVDEFVAWSVKNTQKIDGHTLYARLYWVIFNNLGPGEQLFTDTKASWPKMKQGFDDLMARHPGSAWNLNQYAHFACLAGDKKTFRKLRKKMGGKVIDQAWQAQPTLDLCEAKYGA